MMPNETRPADYEFPCLVIGEEGDAIAETDLDGVRAGSFYILEGIAGPSYHIVQTVGLPIIEASMYISGGGLDNTFDQILSTFKFLD